MVEGKSASGAKVVLVPPHAPKALPASKEQSRAPSIRINTHLVQINVTVTTPSGQAVTALQKKHFRIFEDKVEQTINSFTLEEVPLSVGVVFDTSGSMGEKLQQSREAMKQFFRSSNPEDEFCLVTFNGRPELAVSLTSSTESILNRLAFIKAAGTTALLDAVYLGMSQMKKASNPRKAILILSDGGDNSSRYTASEIRHFVLESDVQVHAIGIRRRTAEDLSGPVLLSELAERTGGQHFPVKNPKDLPDIAAKIATALRQQYIIGYSPSNRGRDGRYRRVKVELVHQPGMHSLRTHYRTGYYAPSQ